MDNEQSELKYDPFEPFTMDSIFDYQGDDPCGGGKVIAYLNAITHYNLALLIIADNAKDFEQLKKELFAFRKDREQFASAVRSCWDKHSKKFIKPSPGHSP